MGCATISMDQKSKPETSLTAQKRSNYNAITRYNYYYGHLGERSLWVQCVSRHGIGRVVRACARAAGGRNLTRAFMSACTFTLGGSFKNTDTFFFLRFYRHRTVMQTSVVVRQIIRIRTWFAIYNIYKCMYDNSTSFTYQTVFIFAKLT